MIFFSASTPSISGIVVSIRTRSGCRFSYCITASLPHNQEAERSVLGAMLLDTAALDAMLEQLKPEDFYQAAHTDIFEAMRSIRANRVLELNPEHKAVAALKAAFEAGDRDKAKDLSLILVRLAELLAGAEIEDPAAFAALVAELF